MKEKNLSKKNLISNIQSLTTSRGITLIALVITIIVMLILAGVTIRIAINGGLFKYANQAVIATENAQVDEALQLKVADHLFNDINNDTQTSVILYLRQEEIIDENNVINVKKLVGQGLSTGKGSFKTKKDIYILEDQGIESTGTKTYNLVYYDKSGVGRIINNLNDIIIEVDNTIKFTIWWESNSETKTYTAKKGMTWYEFCEEYPEYYLFCYDGENGDVTGVNGGFIYKKGDGFQKSVKGSDLIEDGGSYETNDGAACVTANTLILTTLNNETTLAKDVKNGDTMVYYNFETNTLEEGTVLKTYIHKNATSFVKYTFEDGSYLEVTDYHPIYTQEGWKSLTMRNGYEKPEIGDKVKTEEGWKTLTNIEEYKGLEDCYDFAIKSKEGKTINNYFANGTLVQSSIN